MKHKIKGWLVNNTLTPDNPSDKILQLESNGSANLDAIIQEMLEEDTGLREETLYHAITLYNRIVSRFILSGISVNTGLFYASARATGVIDGGVWNPDKNSIYVVFNQGKELRQEIEKTTVEILGERSNVMYILETEDRKTKLKDGSATAGRNLFVRGAMLKVVGNDEAVGVTLKNEEGTVTKLEEDHITSNKPSELILLLPSTLEDGEYELTVTTQYTGGTLLKSPRSASVTVWVGGKPEDDRPELPDEEEDVPPIE